MTKNLRRIPNEDSETDASYRAQRPSRPLSVHGSAGWSDGEDFNSHVLAALSGERTDIGFEVGVQPVADE